MTSTKRKNKTYTKQFKEETVALVTEQGYSVIDAAEAVGVRPNQIYAVSYTHLTLPTTPYV